MTTRKNRKENQTEADNVKDPTLVSVARCLNSYKIPAPRYPASSRSHPNHDVTYGKQRRFERCYDGACRNLQNISRRMRHIADTARKAAMTDEVRERLEHLIKQFSHFVGKLSDLGYVVPCQTRP